MNGDECNLFAKQLDDSSKVEDCGGSCCACGGVKACHELCMISRKRQSSRFVS